MPFCSPLSLLHTSFLLPTRLSVRWVLKQQSLVLHQALSWHMKVRNWLGCSPLQANKQLSKRRPAGLRRSRPLSKRRPSNQPSCPALQANKQPSKCRPAGLKRQQVASEEMQASTPTKQASPAVVVVEDEEEEEKVSMQKRLLVPQSCFLCPGGLLMGKLVVGAMVMVERLHVQQAIASWHGF